MNAITEATLSPLSYHQERLSFIDRFETGAVYQSSPIYHNIPLAVRFAGEIDVALLRESLNQVVKRHEGLSTLIVPEGERVFQSAGRLEEVPLQLHDLADDAPPMDEARATRLILENIRVPFVLEGGPLIRAALYRRGSLESLLVVVVHHIVADRLSMRRIGGELAEIYDALSAGRSPALPGIGMSYNAFSKWQQGLAAKSWEPYWLYWKNRLAGERVNLEIPLRCPRHPVHIYEGAIHRFSVPGDLAQAVRRVSVEMQAGVFDLLLASFCVLLRRYSGQEGFLIGVSDPCRGVPGTENAVGPFSNLLPMDGRAGAATFKEFLASIVRNLRMARRHRDLPFDLLVQKLKPANDMSRTALFDVFFHYEEEARPALRFGELRGEVVETNLGFGKYDLNLLLQPEGDGFAGILVFNNELCERGMVEQMMRHFQAVIAAVVLDPEVSPASLPLLSLEERKQQIEGWNRTNAVYPKEKTIHELIEEQAAKRGGATAVKYEEVEISYSDLEARANRLAQRLRKQGVRADRMVAICLERGIDMVVAVLAVLKAGGGYLPMDPLYPEDRKRFLLTDAGVDHLISQESVIGGEQEQVKWLTLVDSDADEIAKEASERPGRCSGPENLAYCIYTSGSTGKPNGVLVEHGQVVRLLRNDRFDFDFRETDVWTLFHSYSFDFSVWEIFCSLTYGAKLIIVPRETTRDSGLLLELVRHEGVTVLNQTPASFYNFAAETQRSGVEGVRLRYVIFGGEALQPAYLKEWHELLPQVKLINMYGITETTVHVTFREVTREDIETNIGNIGVPIPTTRTYALDGQMEPVPPGVKGEIYVGGRGVTRGYLNRPELTAARFVPDALSGEPGGRLYRAGDVARYRHDGSMEYLGRIDQQVKLRGFRIELGEIETALLEQQGVDRAVVVLSETAGGQKQLVGYVVSKGRKGGLEIARLREGLRQKLPGYMVPSALMEIDEVPLTVNGKVDRKRLPEVSEGGETEEAYVALKTIEEEVIGGIFSDVLKVERVGAEANFFELGGHSLLATQVMSRIRNVFNAEVPLRALFEAPTVRGLAGQVRAARSAGRLARPRMQRAARESALPLSFAQQRMWFLYQLEPGSAAYNMPFALRLRGPLNKDALKRSVNEIVRRHEVLRTTFDLEAGEPVQKIAAAPEIAIEETNLIGSAERDAEVQRLAHEEAVRPFDLAAGPLVRMCLLRTGEQEHVLLVTMHHIVTDGWSMGIMVRELTRLYEANVNGDSSPLPELAIQYGDYAVWQREWLRGEVLEQQLGYWKDQLAGAAVLELPADHARPAMPTRRGAVKPLYISRELKSGLESVGRRAGTTLYMTMLACFQALLGRYAGQDDVVVGAPIAGRSYEETEGLIGLFFNVLTLRSDVSGDRSWMELLSQVREMMLSAYEHQDLPFERLVAELELGRDLRYSPLFQVIFEMNNVPREEIRMAGVNVEGLGTDTGAVKVDLTMTLGEGPEGDLLGTVQYSLDLFEGPTIERLIGHYVTLLEGMVGKQGEALVSGISLLSAAERRQLVEEWNQTALDYADRESLSELFERQAAKTPEKTAVEHGARKMTYAQLEKRANQIGHYLRKRGVGPEVRVGLCVGRSVEMVTAMLGILKAGGAYVPLDASYPVERVRYMLEDAAVSLVVTEERLTEWLRSGDESVNLISLDGEQGKDIGKQGGKRPLVHVEEDNLAYIYYTSGSTGRPKGVAVGQRGIVNYVKWGIEAYEAAKGRGAAVHTSMGVDLTLTNFLPLFVGGKMVLVDDQGGVEGLVELLKKGPELSLLKITPTHLALLNPRLTAGEMEKSTRLLVIGADNLVAEPTLVWREQAPAVKLLNEYGPTETVVGCSIYRIGEESVKTGAVPIGRPIANMRMYVLDREGEPSPAGIAGELYIGGEGVARGYWGRPDLTAERFVPDAFSANAGDRLYRTGDRARHLKDGNLEFLGRLDHQVKIRGYRIETGEIEAVLSGCEGVRKAMVVVREDTPGEKRLVGYVAAEPDDVDAKLLREYLKDRLPEYMVPAAFVVMAELPVRASGKIDPKDLPRPETEGNAENYVAPSTEVEEKLCAIWEKVLNATRVGVRDNFFELGGDSILCIQVITRAREEGIYLTPRQMFERQTVAELAQVAGTEAEAVIADQGVVSGEVGLLPMQAAFLAMEMANPDHYNQSVLLELSAGVDSELLEQAVVVLLEQHDGLRMRYERSGQGWRQWCEAQTPGGVYVRKNLSHLEGKEQRLELERDMARVQAGLSLEAGEVARIAEYELGRGRRKRLLLVVHHLVMDGVSWRVLLEDLERGYRQLSSGEVPDLGRKTTSLQQWAGRLREYGQQETVRAEVGYWSEERRRKAARLPRDYDARPEDNVYGAQGVVTAGLSEEETRALLQEVPGVYHTQINDALVTALGRVCVEWAGGESVLVDMEGHGREELFKDMDLSRTTGWFTSVYPVLLEREGRGGRGEWQPGEWLKGVKEKLRKVPSRGVGYQVLRYLSEDDEVRNRLAEIPEAEIGFNYLGQVDQIFRGSELFDAGREKQGEQMAAENRRFYVLDVVSMVAGGKLQVNWSYSEKLHQRRTIERIAARYVESLRELIAHCRREEAGGYTPSDFPLAGLSQQELEQWIGRGTDVEDIYPLSPMQQGMLFHTLYETGSGMYFVQSACEIEGDLDASAFRRAWNDVVQRHEVLRTDFLWEGLETPVQIVRRSVDLPWREEDWRGLSAAEKDRSWEQYLHQDWEDGFNLSQGPLLRLALMRMEEQKYYFAWSLHHLVLDGWCRHLVVQEVFALYEAYRQGRQPQMKRPPLYRDYIAWLQKQDEKKMEAFWRKELEGFASATRLNVAGNRGEAEGRGEGRIVAGLGAELNDKLTELGRRRRLTVNSIVQGAWALLLSRYSGEPEVVFGGAVSGRSASVPGIETMLGVFFNTLPVRVSIEAQETVAAYLQRLQERQAEAREYEFSPLMKVQKWSEVPRGTPLFEYMMVVANFPLASVSGVTSGSMIVRELGSLDANNYPLTLTVHTGGEIAFRCDYRRPFNDDNVGQMLRHLRTLLEGMVENQGETRMSEISLLKEEERRQLTEQWNGEAAAFEGGEGLAELFGRQAAKTPENTAVEHGEKRMTYGELERRANQLGHYLRKQGVGPEVRVGLCVGRSAEMVVGMLGILKAGGAYVPLDAGYPAERVRYMLEDAVVNVVVTEEPLREWLGGGDDGRALICVDGEQGKAIAKESGEPPTIRTEEENLAYIYYTSGSTGRPKGVAVGQRGIVNYVKWGIEAYEAGGGNGAAVHTSMGVDLTLTNFLPLFVGGKMVLVDDQGGVEGLVELLKSGPELSLLKITPTHLTLLTPRLTAAEMRKSTRVLVVGADNLVAEPTLLWREQAPTVKLLNEYGPTETVVGCSIYRIGPDSEKSGPVPIGRAIANMRMCVLDREGQPSPTGIAGELYIGGVGVARGYQGRPDLTAERFVPDAFSPQPGERLYKTGDRARYLKDGNLEFLGRLDHQVKIRGYRIEPGEIEAVLSGCEGVRKAMVVVREDEPGEKRLVGYVAADAAEVDGKRLREYLKERVPDYMVPAAFMVMEELPVRASGKIDPKDLPRPEMEGSAETYVAPSTETEEKLCEIWSKVLGVARVGVRDNFFELGGDSILCVQVITRAREEGIQLTPRDMFERPTVAELAEAAGSAGDSAAEQGPIAGEVDLLPMQAALLALEMPKPDHYNHSMLLELPEDVNSNLLEQSVMALLDQHDALRMRYQREEDGWRQWCVSVVAGGVYERRELLWLEDAEQRAEMEADIARIQSGLDLEAGQVMRVVEYDLGAGGRRLLVVIHQLVADRASWTILLQDLDHAYKQLAEGAEEVRLGRKTISVRQWVKALKEYGDPEQLRQEFDYWTSDDRAQAHSPYDHDSANAQNRMAAQENTELDEEETGALLREVPEVYHTEMKDVLLTALGRACGEWSGDDSVLIDIEESGREKTAEAPDLSRTVGRLDHVYPIVLRGRGAWHPEDAVSRTKEHLRAVPNRGLGYGVLRYMTLSLMEDGDLRARMRAMPEAAIRFRFAESPGDTLDESALFRPAAEDGSREIAEENRRPYVLEIDARVVEGRLRTSFTFSGRPHQRESVAGIANRYLEVLRELIAHCRSEQAGGFTASDFPLAKMSSKDLDELASLLDE